MKSYPVLMLLLTSACALWSQKYHFRSWSVEEGLPSSQINHLFQDSKGYLWLATFGSGLVKFDGKAFTTYSEKDGLTNTLMRGFAEDKNGDIWVGTLGGGAYRFDGQKLIPFPENDKVPFRKRVYSVKSDLANLMWFGTDSGVYSWNGKELQYRTGGGLAPKEAVMEIFIDKDNNAWIGYWNGGLGCFTGDKFILYNRKNGFPCDTVLSIGQDNAGNVWAGLSQGVCIIKGFPASATFSKVYLSKEADASLVQTILNTKDGKMFIGTSTSGIAEISEEMSVRFITSKNGLPLNTVYDLMMDIEGNIWASCWSYGITQFRSRLFTHFPNDDKLDCKYVNCFASAENGSMFVGTSAGLRKISRNGDSITSISGLPGKNYTSIYPIGKGKWLIGGAKGVCFFFDGKNAEVPKNYIKSGSPESKRLARDQNGKIWLASWGMGAGCLSDTGYRHYLPSNGFCCDYLTTVFVDSQNRVWFGTWDHGLCMIDQQTGKIHNYMKKHGLPQDYVNCITEDSQDRIWVGTNGGGIAMVSSDSILSFGTETGILSGTVNSILVQKNKYVWLGTSKGISRLDLHLFDSLGIVKFRNYGKAEGFTPIECGSNALHLDGSGRIWIGTKKGASMLDPDEEVPNLSAPKLFLSAIELFFKPFDWTLNGHSYDTRNNLPIDPKLKYDQNHLTFRFTGISLTLPEKVKYRYMLDGVDKEWSPETPETQVTYSGLNAGDFTFLVKACNNEGIWSEPVSFSFSISAPFYKSTWFLSSLAFLVAASFYGWMRVRTHNLERGKRLLEEKVAERTAEVVQQKNVIEARNKDITDSINYAKRIQYTLLANESIMQSGLHEYFILFKPKDIVSGDFYWAASPSIQGEGRSVFFLAACDSTGHGVPGAFMSLLNISFLNEAVKEKNLQKPDEILDYVRSRLVENISTEGQKDGMDATLLSFNKQDGRIEYAAAYNPPFMVRNSIAFEFTADKMPVGLSDRMNSFKLQTMDICKGDMVYLYTDGFPDQFGGPKGKKLKRKMLLNFLVSISHMSAAEQHVALEGKFQDWKGELEQIDDVLIIGIRI